MPQQHPESMHTASKPFPSCQSALNFEGSVAARLMDPFETEANAVPMPYTKMGAYGCQATFGFAPLGGVSKPRRNCDHLTNSPFIF